MHLLSLLYLELRLLEGFILFVFFFFAWWPEKNGLLAVAGVQNRVHENKSQVGHSTYTWITLTPPWVLHISAKGKSP